MKTCKNTLIILLIIFISINVNAQISNSFNTNAFFKTAKTDLNNLDENELKKIAEKLNKN